MKKIVIYFLLLLFACFILHSPALAHERGEHDKDIESVLFGNDNYKDNHPIIADVIQALEDATYLAVDQFNGNGEAALENLKSRGIKGIPSEISEFNIQSNYTHRSLTHRGWTFDYEEKAHWPIRQDILRNTVKSELFSKSNSLFSLVPWLSETISQNNSNDDKIESFCILLYYIHIIGDHLEAEKSQDLAYVAPLVRPNDRQNPGVIPDLMKSCEVLFCDQSGSYTYLAMIGEMDSLYSRAEKLYSSQGGINSESKFTAYHQCAIDLMQNVMTCYIPELLKNEPFFRDTFYRK